MKNFNFIFCLFLLCTLGCTTMEPALSVAETNTFPVKGRQGFLINQKLKFGEYQTSKVRRSWTRGGNTRIDLLGGTVHNPAYPNLVSMDYADRDQSYYFQMNDGYGNASDVYAISEFHSRDLQIGDNPNSVVNILEDIFGGSGYSDNLFYLQLFLNKEMNPWQLVLDNHAAQVRAEDYNGIFALNEEQYYVLKPVNRIKKKDGSSQKIVGSVGYEIFDNKNRSVAAVSTVDGGKVFFHTPNPDERFLMASLCAALLLQQDVSEEF